MLDSAGRRAAPMRSGAPGRCDSGHPPASAATHPIRVRGSNSRTTRYTCGRAIRGIFPPVLLEAQVERLAQQAHGKMVMPAGPGVRLQPHVALLGLKLGFVRHLEVWPETRFSPSWRFLNVDWRCNSGFLKRIAYTTMPYKTGLRLLGVARNPANGFPARLLDPPTWARVSRGGSSGAFWIGSSGVRGRPDSGATLPRPLR